MKPDDVTLETTLYCKHDSYMYLKLNATISVMVPLYSIFT